MIISSFIKKLFRKDKSKEINIKSYWFRKDSPILGADVILDRLKLNFKNSEQGEVEFLEVIGIYKLVDHPSIEIEVPLDEQDFFLRQKG